MAIQIFLGEPPAHIKQWIIDHQPMKEEPDPVDTSDWGKLVAALEDCTPSDFNGLNYVGENELLTSKPVGSALGVQYKLDGATPVTTRWINLGYNGSIPEYAKYRRQVGSGWRHVWVKTMKDSLLAPIAVGDAIYTRTFDVPTSEYSYEEYDVIESIGTGTFTYGNNCTWAVPLSFTTVGGKTYDFCGYNMTLNSEAILTDLVWDPNAPVPCLLKGTKIMLANGTEKNIEDITYNDELLVWNFDEGKQDIAKPIWIKAPKHSDYHFESTFGNGTVLKTMGEFGHRCFDIDKNTFVYNTELVSDSVATKDGTTKHLSCIKIEADCEYYNIITDKHFNCYANGILTSCRLNNLYKISDMKFVKDSTVKHDRSEFTGIAEDLIAGLRLLEQPIPATDLKNYVAVLNKTSLAKGK